MRIALLNIEIYGFYRILLYELTIDRLCYEVDDFTPNSMSRQRVALSVSLFIKNQNISELRTKFVDKYGLSISTSFRCTPHTLTSASHENSTHPQ